MNDRDVKVNIFDMAGHPIFYEVKSFANFLESKFDDFFSSWSKVRNEFYRDTQGVILVYDVTNRASFEALESWLSEMKAEIGNPSDMDNIVFIVCANKVSFLWSEISV